ncbi:hypothetical protein [Phenylobacterium sp.]|uniref:hypothetical protein n=1 Tax=Phenylobacterium sp. TaxID=1871053 RepID=UPI002FE1AF31
MADAGTIAGQAERLRAAGALGRSGLLVRLFDYLAEGAASGARPKEVEIALQVFGRDAAFDGAQDASVRVAMHRLRKKLDEYYAGPARAEPVRLAIPVGEYRLVLRDHAAEVPSRPPRRRWPWIAAGLLAAVNLLVLGIVWQGAQGAPGAAAARREPWAGLLRSDRPLVVVVGDYYIFGETDPATGAGRLVREYGVDSHEDLEAFRRASPEAAERLRDLDLYYLPVGAAHALASVLPVLARGGETPRIVMASDLTSEMLRGSDIVYLGYLSGLGPLRDATFSASRFRPGDTWDELADTRSRRVFLSQEGGPGRTAGTQRDYGYLTAFPGPEGGRILVIAGMRDVGLMEAAEAAVRPATLVQLGRAQGAAGGFEALVEADGMRRSNIAGRLVVAAPLEVGGIWTRPRRDLLFPAG